MTASFRDIELLSAYLDGQLDSKESARLESRLKSDESLRAVLDDLRAARGILRQLPQRRAPAQLHADSANGGHQTADAARLSRFSTRCRAGNFVISDYVCDQWIESGCRAAFGGGAGVWHGRGRRRLE